MKSRITPEKINELNDNEIFVFGSNLAGLHLGGAANLAHNRWGAVMGKGIGLAGKTYAIPTVDIEKLKSLKINEIKSFVDEFILFAKNNTNLTFFVTEIGCGIAGFHPNDIAPLFKEAVNQFNIYLPQRFWEVLI